jgi:hypothetical protein
MRANQNTFDGYSFHSFKVAQEVATMLYRMTGDSCKAIKDSSRRSHIVRIDPSGKEVGLWNQYVGHKGEEKYGVDEAYAIRKMWVMHRGTRIPKAERQEA